MNDDILIIQLRDCFTAGYTLPQFCIDNDIKKPLFISIDERRAYFLWEIYVQFKFDKRITPKFTLLNGKTFVMNFAAINILRELKFENLDDITLNEHDRIIFLNTVRLEDNIPNLIYLDQLTDYFIRHTYSEIPLLHFIQRNPNIKLLPTVLPHQPKICDPEFTRLLFERYDLMDKIKNSNGIHVPNTFDKLGYSNKDVYKLVSNPIVKTNLDGSTYMEDDENPFFGIKNGRRMTAYQPENFINKIYFVGGCHIYGINAPFYKNIPSYLQKMLNENNLPYRVENESQFFAGRMQDTFYVLNNLRPKSDDIIIVETSGINPEIFPCLDLRNAFDSYDPRNIWGTQGHVNEIGYKILAEKIFNFFTQNNFFKDVNFEYSTPPHRLIATVFRVKIPRRLQKIFTAKSWTNINKNFVKNALKSVA